MPLIYLPLIMYTSWMEFMLQPLRPAPITARAPSNSHSFPIAARRLTCS
jgi:hypothetical protein